MCSDTDILRIMVAGVISLKDLMIEMSCLIS
jgi:hypothetical protein